MSEQSPELKASPKLLELNTISEITDETDHILLYFPPIMSKPYEEPLLRLNEENRAIFAIDVKKYGHPDFELYISQVIRVLEGLPGFDKDKLVVIGFSLGSKMAAHVGKSLGLSKEKIFLLAPTILTKNSGRIRAALKHLMRGRDGGHEETKDNYAQRLLNAPPENFSSPKAELTKKEKIKILNFTRKQWAGIPEDLDCGTVVAGKRDFLSPISKGADYSIDASHYLSDFIKFIGDTLLISADNL